MKNFKKTLLIAFGLLLMVSANAQTPEESEVLAPVNMLFDGMLKADTGIVKKAFAINVVMKVVTEQGSKTENFRTFINQIANKDSSTGDWIEKIYNTEVRIDGNLAHVWTDYSFYVGDQFSHCGVDSFGLIKLDGTWKIVYIMDTRRKTDCEQE